MADYETLRQQQLARTFDLWPEYLARLTWPVDRLRAERERGLRALEVSYLETGKHENLAFYGREGFSVVGDARVIGAPTWFLRREPSQQGQGHRCAPLDAGRRASQRGELTEPLVRREA